MNRYTFFRCPINAAQDATGVLGAMTGTEEAMLRRLDALAHEPAHLDTARIEVACDGRVVAMQGPKSFAISYMSQDQ